MAILSKSVLYDMYVATELSGDENTAYKISKANADSGWSFGQCQWDLLKNTSNDSGTPRDVFRNILSTPIFAETFSLRFEKDFIGVNQK
jgi:hypothetical protein